MAYSTQGTDQLDFFSNGLVEKISWLVNAVDITLRRLFNADLLNQIRYLSIK